ncbi:MAG: lipopolysaccharide biosynthesis protein, partial [Xanthomonadales bacterium]|nr:lipopolysaccharide biosynthesis protein [Xanthomonadales bacterium]
MDIQVWVGASSLLALSSMAGTALAWRYALHRQLLDQPGGRRLHARPTVRGAGIAAMLVFLLALPAGASWLA